MVRVYGLLEEASAWLRARGSTQWNPVYPLARFGRDIEHGHVWHWTLGPRIAATVTLLPSRPEYYPPDVWADRVTAWYLTRLAVARALSGQSIGARLLGQIETDARAAQVRALRLDVSAENRFLEQYYAARGFRRVAAGDIFGTPSTFFEQRLEGAAP